MQFKINPDCRKLIKEGKCQADCCGIVPFDAHLFRMIRSKAVVKDYEIQEFKTKGQKFVMPVAEDYKCIFLDRQNCSCVIYKHPAKPNLCKMFGTVENEPLMACRHINPELASKIDEEANATFEQIKKFGIAK